MGILQFRTGLVNQDGGAGNASDKTRPFADLDWNPLVQAVFNGNASISPEAIYIGAQANSLDPTHLVIGNDYSGYFQDLTVNGAMATNLAMNSHYLSDLPVPVAENDAATKNYVDTQVGVTVPTARTISTTAPLYGGGDLSANRTFNIAITYADDGGAVALQPTLDAGVPQLGSIWTSGVIEAKNDYPLTVGASDNSSLMVSRLLVDATTNSVGIFSRLDTTRYYLLQIDKTYGPVATLLNGVYSCVTTGNHIHLTTNSGNDAILSTNSNGGFLHLEWGGKALRADYEKIISNNVTVLDASGATMLLGSTWDAPGAIGAVTPNDGAFTFIDLPTAADQTTNNRIYGKADGLYGYFNGAQVGPYIDASSIPASTFDAIGSGTNLNALLIGGTFGPTGAGVVTANSAATATNAAQLLGSTWASPAAIGTGTAAAGTFTTLATTGQYNPQAAISMLVDRLFMIAADTAITRTTANPQFFAFGQINPSFTLSSLLAIGGRGRIYATPLAAVTPHPTASNHTSDGTTVTIKTSSAHTYSVGMPVLLAGWTWSDGGGDINKMVFVKAVPSTTTFTFDPATYGGTCPTSGTNPSVVGTVTSKAILRLASEPTIPDALADVMIGASAATQKPLVVQVASGQTANGTEWQSNAGSVMAAVSNTGAATFTDATLGAANTLAWTGRSKIVSSADGRLSISNAATDIPIGLVFGDVTNATHGMIIFDSVPSFKFRTATNSAYIGMYTGSVISSGSVIFSGGSGLIADAQGTGYTVALAQNAIRAASGLTMNWYNSATMTGVADVGLARSAAGILKATNGGAGLGAINCANIAVSGLQVVGAQGAAIADATNEADAVTKLNLLLAHFRTWGSIAT